MGYLIALLCSRRTPIIATYLAIGMLLLEGAILNNKNKIFKSGNHQTRGMSALAMQDLPYFKNSFSKNVAIADAIPQGLIWKSNAER